MLPSSSGIDVANDGLFYTIELADIFLEHFAFIAKFSYLKHLPLREHGPSVVGSIGMTTLKLPILLIVAMSSGKKMLRINTRRIVAFMTYAKASRNFAKGEFIRKAMSFYGVTCSFIDAENAIAFLPAGRPFPTSAMFLDYFRPKPSENFR